MLENYSRGWRGRFAKSLGRVTGAGVRIPHSPWYNLTIFVNSSGLVKSGSLSTVVGWSQLRSRKDEFRPFFFDVESDENSFFEVFKVPKTKGIALDKFDEIIGCFQFGVGSW